MKAKIVKICAYALATVALGGALVYYNFVDKPVPSVDVGTLCPNFSVATYERKEGQFVTKTDEVTVEDFRGKVLIVNFWSTTCGSCMVEMPHFDEFQKDYMDEVVILALDGEIGWSYEMICSWMNVYRTTDGMLKEEGKITEMYQWDTFDITFGFYPETNDVGKALGFSGSWPSTAVIDKKGFIQYKHQGAMSYEDLEEVVKPLI